jgi:hypothetical protein
MKLLTAGHQVIVHNKEATKRYLHTICDPATRSFARAPLRTPPSAYQETISFKFRLREPTNMRRQGCIGKRGASILESLQENFMFD